MNHLTYACMFLVLLFHSCKKTEERSGLIGKWLLIATLDDPGDGSGTWRLVSQPASIQLFPDGSVKTINMSNFHTYKVIDSVTIEFTSADNKFNYKYGIEGRLLELNPPCIEPCGLRFKRMD